MKIVPLKKFYVFTLENYVRTKDNVQTHGDEEEKGKDFTDNTQQRKQDRLQEIQRKVSQYQ